MFEKTLYEHAGSTETPCLLVRGRQTDLVTSESAQAFVKRMDPSTGRVFILTTPCGMWTELTHCADSAGKKRKNGEKKKMKFKSPKNFLSKRFTNYHQILVLLPNITDFEAKGYTTANLRNIKLSLMSYNNEAIYLQSLF